MKNAWKILCLLLVVIVVTLAIILSNPLRRSEQSIRARLLEETPLGTHLSEVRSHIVDKGWKIVDVNEASGYLDQRENLNVVIGDKSIRASLGEYQDIPFQANVTVFWGFDADSHLIDIWVWKTWDGL